MCYHMAPKQYRSSESPNRSVSKLVRLDPSIAATLTASAQDTNISENAIVNDALANYFATNVVLSATQTLGEVRATGSLISHSVQNYSATLATVRDEYQDTISKLSGTPQGEGGTT